jgi:16S rRNA (guanine527-N7)-methyltransferase
LPAEYDAAVADGLREVGITLTTGARRSIDDHVRLLLAWNAAINLTAIRDPVEIARRHVVDSLAAVPLFRARKIGGFIDLGSGGGFPGLPLAAATNVERAMLVDSVGKKAAFLGAAVEATGLRSRVSVAASRAETLAADPRHRQRWPAVTARAVGALAEILELAFPLLLPGGCVVAWKRGEADDEMAAGRRAIAALGGGRIEIHGVAATGLAGHRLVVATKRGRTAGDYPRDPAARRRRPW